MATFITPTDPFVYWAERGESGIMSYLAPGPRGRNVFKLTDGSFTESQPYDPADIAITYHGGHVHTVTGQEEADLIAGGYGDYINYDSVFKYKFSSSTTYSDPGPGVFKFNSSNISTTTEINVDSINSSGENVQSSINSVGGKKILKIVHNLTGTRKFSIFDILYVSSSTGWWHIVGASYVSGQLPINGEDCVFSFE